jgi:hypothetical protein
MPVGLIVSRLLCVVQTHKSRVAAVAAAVVAVLASRRLSAAWMGRALLGGSPKHAIKRFDRLFGNAKLAAEQPLFYSAICCALVKQARPTILVDWTCLQGRWHALVASVAISGRSAILYGEVHHVTMLNNPEVQDAFLRKLHSLLPNACPIVVCDAGFHGDFFRTVTALGWDFVARIRGTAQFRCAGTTHTKKSLYKKASSRPLDFPRSELYVRRSIKCRLVLVRRPHSRRRSKPTANKELLEYRKAARDPWLLATTLETHRAEQIISLYGMRMQIEESFRDAKSGAYGLGLNETRSRTRARIAVKLLIAALALAAAQLIGIDAEERNVHRSLQANSTSNRRVLSLVRLGLEVVRRVAHELTASSLGEALAVLRPLIRGDP